MQNFFRMSVLALAVAASGCSVLGGHHPTELELGAPQSQYDDRIQDALGAQKYSEAELLYQRQFNGFQTQLDELEKKRRSFDAALNARGYESGIQGAPASEEEAGRISEYQAASRATQARVAELTSKSTLDQSRVENRRDQDLLDIDSRTSQEIAAIEEQSAMSLSKLEDEINQEIEGRRSIDSAARAEENNRLNEQRITLVLANAESERQARQKLAEAQSEFETIQGQANAKVAEKQAQISDLRRQISLIEAQIQSESTQDAVHVKAQQGRVDAAKADVERLAKITSDLKRTGNLTASGSVDADYAAQKAALLGRAREEAQARKAKLIADANARAARAKTAISTSARTEVATLKAQSEMGKADLVSPVVTGRAVYSGGPTRPAGQASAPTRPPIARPQQIIDRPMKSAQRAPVLTVTRFEPRVSDSPSVVPTEDLGNVVLAGTSGVSAPQAPTSVPPLVVAAKTRTIFDVFYVYQDEGSWKKFQDFLRAYGIHDFEPTRDRNKGQYFIYCGRYYAQEEASARVAYLNRTTATTNVQVRETIVPR